MLKMEMIELPANHIMKAILCLDSGTREALQRSAAIKAQMEPYQAAALYVLARQYNAPAHHILEIGTAAGYSASLLAQAAPLAHITTLNPATHEIPEAMANLGAYQNIAIIAEASWDFLAAYNGPKLSLIFVDGDHKRVARDMPWWDWLSDDGLMLFHDYTPHNAPPVVAAVDELGARLGRKPDVLVIDDRKRGMAGFYKEV